MGLRGWSWDAQWGPAGLGDRPLLEALQAAIPDETVDAVIEATGTREQRRRRLPTHVVVTLVVAMGLWASESVRHALANVVAGWREGAASGGSAWQLPTNAALVRARQRAGVRLFRLLFHAVAGPIATVARQAHFLGRTKVNSVLKPTELLPDGSFLARIYPTPTARRRDRDGITLRVIEYALDTPAGPGQDKYRLVTSLLDERAFPAEQLAAAYHERWEIETTLDEVKVHQWAHPRPLRSQHPREVVQEVYGLLLAHLAIRTLMHQAALQQGTDPDRLSFTGALRVLRRAIPRAQRTWPEAFPFFATTS